MIQLFIKCFTKYSKVFAWKLILQNGLYANEIIFGLKMEGF